MKEFCENIKSRLLASGFEEEDENSFMYSFQTAPVMTIVNGRHVNTGDSRTINVILKCVGEGYVEHNEGNVEPLIHYQFILKDGAVVLRELSTCFYKGEEELFMFQLNEFVK